MNADRISREDRELGRTVAAPYLRLIDELLAGTIPLGDFVARYEATWAEQPGRVPDAAYEPINHLCGVVEAWDPEFAAEGDDRYTTDDDVVAAAAHARAELLHNLR